MLATPPVSPVAPRRGDTKRTAALYLLAFLSVYAAVELVSLITFTVIAQDRFSFSRLQERRNVVRQDPGLAPAPDAQGRPGERPPYSRAIDGPRAKAQRHEVIHPFVGYVADPAKRPEVNEYGFVGPPPPLNRAASSDTVVVAVLGGSVAEGLVMAGGLPGKSPRERLALVLGEARPFAGKEVVVYCLALSGMKQPQQVMTVNYFMSLGARFDLVINLDGFNEIVLPMVENRPAGTFPFYPRMWDVRVSGLGDADLLRKAGRIAFLESIRLQAARFLSIPPLRYSVTANLFWYLADHGLVRRTTIDRTELTLALLDRKHDQDQGRSYAASGPARAYASDEAHFADLAAYWKRSSVLLNQLARGSGFHYFHFLQPNQYVSGSKIFSEEERAIALPAKHPYAMTATQGYPYLIAAGRELVTEGVPYSNLTMLFAGRDEVLYVDGCCHFNRRGYELMALEIGRVIRDALNRR